MIRTEFEIGDYAPLVGEETIERLRHLGFAGGILHVNATPYGGGVAEILSSLVPLKRSLGLKAEWRAFHAPPQFFTVTKTIHNGLQGGDVTLTPSQEELYRNVAKLNTRYAQWWHDIVFVHDAQCLPLIEMKTASQMWIWVCHVDVSDPNPEIWNFLKYWIHQYDVVVFSLTSYVQDIPIPQIFIPPAIDPLSPKNLPMSTWDAESMLTAYGIPLDKPIVAQISRFDKAKNFAGLLDAEPLCREQHTMVLLGNHAQDDPESVGIYRSLYGICRSHHRDVLLLDAGDDPDLVNALQSRADVIVQNSYREGFGLTITEAMWKRRPVIVGDAPGPKRQIQNGKNGFVISSDEHETIAEQLARRIDQLLADPHLRQKLGENAHRSVRSQFLITRLLEDYLRIYPRLFRSVSARFAPATYHLANE